MKGIFKRFTALMAALMLLMSAGAALAAEAPAKMELPAAYKVIEAGGAIGYEASARFDPMMLKSLVIMMMGGDPSNEAMNATVDQVFSALNKLSLVGIYSKNDASGVLGTDKGEVANFQVSINEETMENSITTNLLPDVALQVDPAMMKTSMAQQSKVTPDMMQEMILPYVGTFTGFFAEQVGPMPEKAATPYEIDGAGQFHYMADFDITTHELAGLMEKLNSLFKADKRLQGVVNQTPSADGKSLEDSLKEAEAGIADMKKNPEAVLITGTVYMNEAGDTSYYVMDTPDTAASRVHVTLLTLGKGLDMKNVKAKVLMKNPAPAMEPDAMAADTEATAEPLPPAPVDWAALEAEILSGQNFRDVLATVDTSVSPSETALATTTKASVVTGGMNIIIQADANSRLDKLEGDSAIKIFMGGETPLVSLALRLFETAEKPAASMVDGRTLVTVKTDDKGELAVSDAEKVKLSLKSGLAVMMENLTKALPEEGPTLVALINNAMNPPQPMEQEAEPMVEEMTPAEPAEEAPAEPAASDNP